MYKIHNYFTWSRLGLGVTFEKFKNGWVLELSLVFWHIELNKNSALKNNYNVTYSI
jgi:hypothetical protein